MNPITNNVSRVVFAWAPKMSGEQRHHALGLAAKAEILRLAFQRCPVPSLKAALDLANGEACEAVLAAT